MDTPGVSLETNPLPARAAPLMIIEWRRFLIKISS
jgi:hypothetical protein